MPKQVAAPRFLRLPEVRQMTGLGKSRIYRRMEEGTFTKQIQLCGRSVVWNEKDLTDWMDEQIKNS